MSSARPAGSQGVVGSQRRVGAFCESSLRPWLAANRATLPGPIIYSEMDAGAVDDFFDALNSSPSVQGYLAHEKPPHPRTLQWAHA